MHIYGSDLLLTPLMTTADKTPHHLRLGSSNNYKPSKCYKSVYGRSAKECARRVRQRLESERKRAILSYHPY